MFKINTWLIYIDHHDNNIMKKGGFWPHLPYKAPMSFTLHTQLQADTHLIGDYPLCRVLLMDNRHFPWLILVPRRCSLTELTDLPPDDYQLVMQEIRMASRHLQEDTKADKMNIATLGNMVPQLHIHVIARFKEDAAWPSPVWGKISAPYHRDDAVIRVTQLRKLLGTTKIT